MKKGNYILDEKLLGVPQNLFVGNSVSEDQDFLLLITGVHDLELKALNYKGIRYFQRCMEEESLTDCRYESIIHPEDYPLFMHFLNNCDDLEIGEERETTVRLKSPFGNWKKFLFKNRLYSGFKDSDEKFILSLARAIDPYKNTLRKNSATNLETEKSLQESLNKYRVLVNSLDSGYSVIEVIFDLNSVAVDYLLVEINYSFEKHVHLKNTLGKTMKELSQDHGEKWFQTYGDIVMTGEAVRFEKYAEDLETWFDIYAFPIGNNKSRKVAILCTDITERKIAEGMLRKTNETLEQQVRKRTSELKEKSDLLQMVFDTVTQGIFLLKPVFGKNGDIVDFTYVRVNKKVKRYYGLKDLVGKSFLKLNPQATKTGAFEIFKQTMISGESKDFEVCFKRNNRDNWFKISTTRQRGMLINSLENITQKKRRAKNLKDTMRFKKQLINTSPDIILIFNLYEEKIRFMNRDFASNPQLSREKVVGMPLIDIIPMLHPQDRQKGIEFHTKLLQASDKDVFEIEFRLKGAEGNWNYYNARAKVFMRNKKGNPYEYIILMRNIQQQKKTQQDLMNAEKLSIKGEIARTLAHELRNPLASIGMSADILDKKLAESQKKDLETYIHIIKRSTTTLNGLVTDLLTTSNYSPPVLNKCCIATTMNKALTQAKDRIYLAGIKVEKHYKGHYYINADKEKLKIALLNIIVNASEAMTPNEGILSLTIKQSDENHIKVYITDNGCGMTKDQIKRLFESFYTNKIGGMGVGLSSVKNIIQEHNASIEVESEPGVGTTFILTFPVYKPQRGN